MKNLNRAQSSYISKRALLGFIYKRWDLLLDAEQRGDAKSAEQHKKAIDRLEDELGQWKEQREERDKKRMERRMINGMRPSETQAACAPRKPLMGVVRGKIHSPARLLVYSLEGVGKSTLAAGSENPIFLCKENGTEQLNIDRLAEPMQWRDGPVGPDGLQRDVWSLTKMVREDEHNFKTFVVDTLDWIEPMLFRYICEKDPGGKNGGNIVLAYGGYGKGFEVALNEWRSWIAQLDAIRKERGMDIVLLAHAHVKQYNNPEGENYDRYTLKMNDKGASLFKEWCDAVLFAHQEIYTSEKKASAGDKKRVFGVMDYTRKLFSNRRPAFDAKNRFGLPDSMPMMWSELIKHIRTRQVDVEALIALAKEQIGFIPQTDQPDAMAALERVGKDPDRLAEFINYVQAQQDSK